MNELALQEARKLEREASARLSSYDGEGYEGGFPMNYEGPDSYEGLENYAGINNIFAGEIDKRTIYVVSIVNVAVATRTFNLIPGPRDGAAGAFPAGTMATGAFNDTGGNAGLSGAGQPQSIEQFLYFIQNNPLKIYGFKIDSDVTAQLAQAVTIRGYSPFKSDPIHTDVVFPSTFTDENVYKDKTVTVKRAIDGNSQTRVSIPVVASSTLTLTLFIGPIYNNAKTLNKKVGTAARHFFRQ